MSFPVRSGTRFGLGWYPADLAACTAGAVAAGYVVTVLPAGSRLRLAAALPLVFFLPGYALTAALFPASARGGRGWASLRSSDNGTDRRRPGGIDTAERLACALALSVVIVPVAVIALAPTAGLATGTVAGGLAGTTAVLAQVGVLRRLRVPEGERYTVSARGTFRRLRGEGGTLATASVLVLVAGVVAAALALGAGLIAPQPAGGFTELGLYTEEEDGDLVADGFPDGVEPDGSVPIVVTVENREGEARNYTVVVEEHRIEDGTVGNRTPLNDTSLALEDGERETTNWTVTPTAQAGTVRIAVLLYEGGSSVGSDVEPLNEVHFWLEIGEEGPETIGDADATEGADGGNGTAIGGTGDGNGTDTDGTDDEEGSDENQTDGTEDEEEDGGNEGTDDAGGDEEAGAGGEGDDGGEGTNSTDGEDDGDGAPEDASEEETDAEDDGTDTEDDNDEAIDDPDIGGDDDNDTPDIFEEIFGDVDDENESG